MILKRRNPTNTFADDVAEHYGAELHRFLARRMHSPQDIEDLVQEVYVRLLRIDNTDFIRNPRAYVLRTAANVALDFLDKSRRARTHVVVDSEVVEQVTEHPHELSGDQLARRLSTQRQLNAALGLLDPVYQAVLLMFYREGYTYEEIAQRLQVSTHQVERYLATAKKKLVAVDWKWD